MLVFVVILAYPIAAFSKQKVSVKFRKVAKRSFGSSMPSVAHKDEQLKIKVKRTPD